MKDRVLFKRKRSSLWSGTCSNMPPHTTQHGDVPLENISVTSHACLWVFHPPACQLVLASPLSDSGRSSIYVCVISDLTLQQDPALLSLISFLCPFYCYRPQQGCPGVPEGQWSAAPHPSPPRMADCCCCHAVLGGVQSAGSVQTSGGADCTQPG